MTRSALYIIILLGILITLFASIARAETQLDQLCDLQGQFAELSMTYRQLGGDYATFIEDQVLAPAFLQAAQTAWLVPIASTENLRSLTAYNHGLDARLLCYTTNAE